MENSPQIAEDEEDDKDKPKHRSWLYEVTQKNDDEKDKKSWFDRFVEDKAEKPDPSEKVDEQPLPKLELIKNEVEPPEMIEAEQAARPVLELVPDSLVEEVQELTETEPVVEEKPEWPKLVEAVKEEVAEEAPDPVTDPVVETFFEKVQEGEEPTVAFEEVMTELGVEESQIEELESETIVDAVIGSQTEAEPAKQVVYESVPDEEPEELQDGSVVQPHTQSAPRQSIQPKAAENIAEQPGIHTVEDAKPDLEQRVSQMKQEIVEKVKKIREVTIKQVEQDGPKVIEAFKQDKYENLETPEPQAKPEHIGHVIVDAESKPHKEKTAEVKPESIPEDLKNLESDPLADRKLETLNRTELLALSERIIIDGSSLRQIFETHLIGERGLRRIIREHLRGGDLKKALQMEIVEREIDFERDPVVRDIPPAAYSAEQNSAPVPQDIHLNNLVQKASAQISGNSEEEAFIRAKAAYEAEQIDQMQRSRRMIDISFVVVISGLLLMVIYLLLRGQ